MNLWIGRTSAIVLFLSTLLFASLDFHQRFLYFLYLNSTNRLRRIIQIENKNPMTVIQCFAPLQCVRAPLPPSLPRPSTTTTGTKCFAFRPTSTSSSTSTSRRSVVLPMVYTSLTTLLVSFPSSDSAPASSSSSHTAISEFVELPNSNGVKVLDIRTGSGQVPVDGDVVFLFL